MNISTRRVFECIVVTLLKILTWVDQHILDYVNLYTNLHTRNLIEEKNSYGKYLITFLNECASFGIILSRPLIRAKDTESFAQG